MRFAMALSVLGLVTIAVADETGLSTHLDALGKIAHRVPPEVGAEHRYSTSQPNPGITSEFRFKGKTNAAVLVVTRIRDDYPKDDRLLDKQRPRSVATQRHFGRDIVRLRAVDADGKRFDEEVFLNCEYSDYSYPYGLGGANLRGDLRELSVQQTFVRDGRFIECSLHLKRLPSEAAEEFIARGQKACSRWAQSVTTAGADTREGNRSLGPRVR